MLIVISPAKSLDYTTPSVTKKFTMPEMLNDAEKLVGRLKKMSPRQLSKLMGISKELGELNFQRYQEWINQFNIVNAKQAVLAFNGDVYQGLDATKLLEDKLEFAQIRLRILSGLYGLLKPLDLIQPYRLEMGTKIKYFKSNNLYEFWNPKLTKKVQEAINESGSNVLINLASNEYFKSVNLKLLKAEVVTPEFKDFKNGQYKMISFFAKKARGLMTRFVLDNNIDNPQDLLAFDYDGYMFNPNLSKPENPVFTREH